MGTKRVMVVGSGAREHALGRALKKSGAELFIAPGNAGTADVGTNVPIRVDDLPGLVTEAIRLRIDLVVVGPELPLSLGLVDALNEQKIAAFGPTKAAAQLESSKAFMKSFLVRHRIPTAAHETFTDANAAQAYVRSAKRPLVVKADGLAAGKGVVVAPEPDVALSAIDAMMSQQVFGAAGSKIVIEEFLPGEEASFHVVCDGTRAVVLAPAQDHKRVGNDDTGPNTGGMGAYAPAKVVTESVHDIVLRTVIEPTLQGMAAEGNPFRGVLFCGLMIDRGVPRVLEFNVRFGDPETSVLVPMYGGDWLALLDGSARGNIPETDAKVRTGAAIAVVMAAFGYPATPRTGDAIDGLDQRFDPRVFVNHAGTKLRDDGRIMTAGGRVLNVGACADTLSEARALAYDAVSKIRWPGEHHRADIGAKALQR